MQKLHPKSCLWLNMYFHAPKLVFWCTFTVRSTYGLFRWIDCIKKMKRKRRRNFLVKNSQWVEKNHIGTNVITPKISPRSTFSSRIFTKIIQFNKSVLNMEIKYFFLLVLRYLLVNTTLHDGFQTTSVISRAIPDSKSRMWSTPCDAFAPIRCERFTFRNSVEICSYSYVGTVCAPESVICVLNERNFAESIINCMKDVNDYC